MKSMEKSLQYKDVTSAQAESTDVPHAVHDEAFLTECATEGTGNAMSENQFNETSVIETQIDPKCSKFQDVLSSDHYNENDTANSNEQVSHHAMSVVQFTVCQ